MTPEPNSLNFYIWKPKKDADGYTTQHIYLFYLFELVLVLLLQTLVYTLVHNMRVSVSAETHFNSVVCCKLQFSGKALSSFTIFVFACMHLCTTMKVQLTRSIWVPSIVILDAFRGSSFFFVHPLHHDWNLRQRKCSFFVWKCGQMDGHLHYACTKQGTKLIQYFDVSEKVFGWRSWNKTTL